MRRRRHPGRDQVAVHQRRLRRPPRNQCSPRPRQRFGNGSHGRGCPTEAPPATEEPVVVVTEVPTEEPTTTPSPTEAPAVTPIATEDTGDGTGGSIADVTPTGGDGTQGSTVQVESGKGVPLSTSTGGGQQRPP